MIFILVVDNTESHRELTRFFSMVSVLLAVLVRLQSFFEIHQIDICPGVGILIGPTVGTTIWRMSHRQSLALIDAKDAEFYQRIAKKRVDASLQSPTSPIPDYYGMEFRKGLLRDLNDLYRRKDRFYEGLSSRLSLPSPLCYAPNQIFSG